MDVRILQEADGEGWVRQFSGCGRKLNEKTMMRFLEKTIQGVAKVDLRIQECQVHAGKRTLLNKIEYLHRSV